MHLHRSCSLIYILNPPHRFDTPILSPIGVHVNHHDRPLSLRLRFACEIMLNKLKRNAGQSLGTSCHKIEFDLQCRLHIPAFCPQSPTSSPPNFPPHPPLAIRSSTHRPASFAIHSLASPVLIQWSRCSKEATYAKMKSISQQTKCRENSRRYPYVISWTNEQVQVWS
jgi:hypothetical protein